MYGGGPSVVEGDSLEGKLPSVCSVELDGKVLAFSMGLLITEPSWLRSGGKEDSAKLEIILTNDQRDWLQFER